jgi:hypothetical protein
MSDVILTHREQEELYVLLKPREDTMAEPLEGLLAKIEQALFQRLTIEEIEELAARFGSGR